MRVYLIGFMGAGKTWLGKQLAERLGMDFIDLDAFIENREGKTILELFEEAGENGFREIEAACLRETEKFQYAVIATGGGTPCFFNNMEWINWNGLSVYLKVSAAVLFERLSGEREERPLVSRLSDEKLLEYIQSKLKERAFFYEQAHLCSELDMNGSCQVNEMVAYLERFYLSNKNNF